MSKEKLWIALVITAVLALLTWAIVGGSASATYARNLEAACASVGGKIKGFGESYASCFKVTVTYTYEPIPMPNVR